MSGERRLLVKEGDREREVLLVGAVTIGRGPLCEISSPDPRLSREHAVIEIAGDQVVIRDLNSRNGTRVNGAPVTEHRLGPNDTVEVGPFMLRVVGARPLAVPEPKSGSEDATVLVPRRGAPPDVDRGAATPPIPATTLATPNGPPAPVSTPPTVPTPAPHAAAPVAAADSGDDVEATRLQRRPPPAAPVATPADEDETRRVPRPVRTASAAPAAVPLPSPVTAPRMTAAPAPPPTPSTAATVAAMASRSAASKELSFAATALLWVLPLALVAFVAGLVPGLVQPDERGPLLQAHYEALATSAVELARTAREPIAPVDSVTTALRKYAGVVSAQVLAPDGRVLAPMSEAGTRAALPAMEGSAPRIQTTDAGVAIHVPANTGDGRPVIVALTVDPSKIHPAPTGSASGVLSLLISLGAAWLVARKVTRITDGRLSRLGEELELMTIGQVEVGRDPFRLRGGQRVLDAATFALSPAARRRPAPSRSSPVPETATGEAIPGVLAATLDADEGFRVVRADTECEMLLGRSADLMRGAHLIDALGDSALVDEVLRLAALATPDHPARGEAGPAGMPFRLGIDAIRRSGTPALSFRFKRL